MQLVNVGIACVNEDDARSQNLIPQELSKLRINLRARVYWLT